MLKMVMIERDGYEYREERSKRPGRDRGIIGGGHRRADEFRGVVCLDCQP